MKKNLWMLKYPHCIFNMTMRGKSNMIYFFQRVAGCCEAIERLYEYIPEFHPEKYS